MILALESVTENQEPIQYTQGEIAYAELHEHEIEFLKPDGQKTVGPILKMSGSTYNVKDKYTGKSFTYKYSGKNTKIEEEQVKTFSEVSKSKPKKPRIKSRYSNSLLKKAIAIAWDKKYAGVNFTGAYNKIEKLKKGLGDDPEVMKQLWLANEEVEKQGSLVEIVLDKGMLRKDFSNVWATKDSELFRVLNVLVGLHGFVDNLKSYKKSKSKFVKALKTIASSSSRMKKAGFSSRDIKYVQKPKKGQNFAEEITEDNRYTMWLPEAEGDKEAYKKFFNKALKKFGVSSPDELEGDKKKEFFDYVDKNWKGDHEEQADVHKSYKMDGRRTNFREKMKKLGYIKGR